MKIIWTKSAKGKQKRRKQEKRLSIKSTISYDDGVKVISRDFWGQVQHSFRLCVREWLYEQVRARGDFFGLFCVRQIIAQRDLCDDNIKRKPQKQTALSFTNEIE